MRARLDTGFLGTFSLLCVWQRVTGTPGTIFGGEAAHTAPSGPFFTRTFLSRPRFFFAFAGLRGLMESLKRHMNLESARWRGG